MSFFILHNYVEEEINKLVDEEIKKHPKAAKDKQVFVDELINYYGIHGFIPEFRLEPK